MGDYERVRGQILLALGCVSLGSAACGGKSERDLAGSSTPAGGDGASTSSSPDAAVGVTATGPSAGTGGASSRAVVSNTVGAASLTSTSSSGFPATSQAAGGTSNTFAQGGATGAGAVCDSELVPTTEACSALDRNVLRIEATPDAECGCPLYSDNGFRYEVFTACAPVVSGLSCNEAYDIACMVRHVSCGLFFSAAHGCGQLNRTGTQGPEECCYTFYGSCAVGRPFIVRGRARRASMQHGLPFMRDFSVQTTELHASSRRALAEAYTQDALTEHASVAAFARFVMECLALAAPLDLVVDAQQALADELEHLRICASLAHAYGAERVHPGPLDVTGASIDSDLAKVAEKVARESCIAETVSAMLLLEASRAAGNARVKALLAQMAEDEIRHALLGYRFVAWALTQNNQTAPGDSAVHFRVRRAFAEAERAVGLGAQTQTPAPEAELRAHGYLPWHERRSIARRTLDQVVLPAARALLAG